MGWWFEFTCVDRQTLLISIFKHKIFISKLCCLILDLSKIPPMSSSGSASRGQARDFRDYLPLYNAAVSGDWETANGLFFEKNRRETEAIISFDRETALHVAAQSGKANDFVRKLVALMSPEALALRDRYGYTALHSGAKVGNTEAAFAMLEKNPALLYMLCSEGTLAVTIAAMYCQKETLEYLISVSKPNVEHSPFEGQLGVELLIAIIGCEFFDVALNLVGKYPNLARLRSGNSYIGALYHIAGMDTVFPSRESFNWWERLIYRYAPLKQHEPKAARATSITDDDVEKANCAAPTHNKHSTSFQIISRVGKQFEPKIWNVMEYLVPLVKDIKEKKTMHKRAIELVNYLCKQMSSLPEDEAWIMLQYSITQAAKHGISEIVEVIMEMYPVVTGSADSTGGNIMHMAARNRFENVFNLTYSMSDRKHLFSNGVDSEDNNLMHMCARLAPPDRLNLVPGAALQMQRELQWFNAMEKFVHTSRRKWINSDGKTPKMLFTEQHEKLKAEGERWMKDTANACSIAAALITTVVFAAAFTVPGGVSSETGIPIFSKESSFVLFSITNAVSLFTSITSLLLFLSILTSRYAEGDFLYVLPKRLTFGLLSLFVSITFMLVAFSAALYLVFQKQRAWFLIPVAAFAWLPVTSFVLLQFPLLVDVFYSTYGPGIFGRKGDRLFY